MHLCFWGSATAKVTQTEALSISIGYAHLESKDIDPWPTNLFADIMRSSFGILSPSVIHRREIKAVTMVPAEPSVSPEKRHLLDQPLPLIRYFLLMDRLFTPIKRPHGTLMKTPES
jgi:hypothetical protein